MKPTLTIFIILAMVNPNQPVIIYHSGQFLENFPKEIYYDSKIEALCVHFFFFEIYSHLTFQIRIRGNAYFEWELNLDYKLLEWMVSLQKDDVNKEIKKKHFDKQNCIPIQLKNILTLRDIARISRRFENECKTYQFYFKDVCEVKSIDEWKRFIDFNHEKALRCLNCFSFTDYVLKEIASKAERDKIMREVLIRGEKLRKKCKRKNN